MSVIVTPRSHDYHACLVGHTEIWGCGKTPNEAVSDLVCSHKKIFKDSSSVTIV